MVAMKSLFKLDEICQAGLSNAMATKKKKTFLGAKSHFKLIQRKRIGCNHETHTNNGSGDDQRWTQTNPSNDLPKCQCRNDVKNFR